MHEGLNSIPSTPCQVKWQIPINAALRKLSQEDCQECKDQPTRSWVRSHSKKLKKKDECLHSSVKADKERCRQKEEREAILHRTMTSQWKRHREERTDGECSSWNQSMLSSVTQGPTMWAQSGAKRWNLRHLTQQGKPFSHSTFNTSISVQTAIFISTVLKAD